MQKEVIVRIQHLLKRREKLEEILKDHEKDPYEGIGFTRSRFLVPYYHEYLKDLMPDLVSVVVGLIKGQIAEIDKELEQIS